MCYINGIQVSKATFLKWKEEQELLEAFFRVARGFDYGDWPIIRPLNQGNSIQIELAQWGLIPDFVQTQQQLQEFRFKYTTLNARNDNLLQSRMFSQAIHNGRCLVLSSGFFEYRHVPRLGKKGQVLKAVDKFPYYITTRRPENEPVFFMAGISQPWTDRESGHTSNTFAIITTAANSLMAQIHNSKLRMPAILNQQQAEEWLSPNLPDNRIFELASTQIESSQLHAYTVGKDFLTSDKPDSAFEYPQLAPVV